MVEEPEGHSVVANEPDDPDWNPDMSTWEEEFNVDPRFSFERIQLWIDAGCPDIFEEELEFPAIETLERCATLNR